MNVPDVPNKPLLLAMEAYFVVAVASSGPRRLSRYTRQLAGSLGHPGNRQSHAAQSQEGSLLSSGQQRYRRYSSGMAVMKLINSVNHQRWEVNRTLYSTLIIDATSEVFAIFFHESDWPVAKRPFTCPFILSITFDASSWRMRPERRRRLGKKASGSHFRQKYRQKG